MGDEDPHNRHSPLVLPVLVMGHEVLALVDSGAQGNYFSPRIVNRLQIPWKQKDAPYRLSAADGEAFKYDDGLVLRETAPLLVTIQNRQERLECDIADISGYDLILGIPWLRESNPRVNWRTGQLQWDTPGRDLASEKR